VRASAQCPVEGVGVDVREPGQGEAGQPDVSWLRFGCALDARDSAAVVRCDADPVDDSAG
jgi:hypothetical protein